MANVNLLDDSNPTGGSGLDEGPAPQMPTAKPAQPSNPFQSVTNPTVVPGHTITSPFGGTTYANGEHADFGHPALNQIAGFYNGYTGSTPTYQDVSGWGTNIDANYLEKIRQSIANSPQALAYQKQLQARAAGAQGPTTGSTAPFDINAWGQDWLKSGGRTLQDWQNYVAAHPLGAGYSLSGSKQDKVVGPNGQGWDAVIGSGLGGQGASWNPFGGGGAGGGGVFTDPATTEWESMLRSLVGRMNQPAVPQDYAPLTDYLRSYFQQLQGPAYSPAQADLLQTQALDPMTRERDAAKQRVLEWGAAHGQGPQSGPVQQRLADLDRQYSQQRTTTQAQFASHAIDLDRQNKQLAASVGSGLNQLEHAQTQSDEQRAMQALGYMFQIPQLADQRMKDAQGVLQPSNPTSLLSLFPQFGQMGLNQSAQSQQLWALLGQALAQAFGQ